jgi:ADP-ribose pyrophosphatase
MIRNARYAVQKTLWELPAGTMERGEKPEKTAEREILEETGYKAGVLEPLFWFYPVPGFCDEVMHVFVAKGLVFQGQQLDASEDIHVETVEWKNALQMVKDGIIIDAKTIATLLYFNTYR